MKNDVLLNSDVGRGVPVPPTLTLFRSASMNIYRRLYEQYFGPIPKGYHIHHKDGDHSNNHIENLQCVSAQEHYDIHYSQGDYGACWAMVQTGHLSISPEERSFISSQTQMKKVEAGTHPFQQKENRIKNSAITSARNKSMKGKTFEELYGEERALEIKQSIGDASRGKSLNLSEEQRLERSERVSGNNNPVHRLTEEENIIRIEKMKKTLKEYYENNSGSNSGKITYNNGIVNIFINPDDIIPEGFTKGRVKQETVICPHCGKEGPKPQMKQWHFDNCKYKDK